MSDPIVFLPGYLCDQRMFCAQAYDLSRDYMVIQAPLLGERCEEMASALLPHLPRRFALVGASLGGVVALEILRKAPDRVTRTCLISTDALPEAPQVSADQEPLLIQARTGNLDAAIQGAVPAASFAPTDTRIDAQAFFADMARSFGPAGFQTQTRAMQRRRDHQSTLYRAQCPVQIVAGAHDQIVTPKRQAFMAELAPSARFASLEEAGHLPSIEAPGALTALLRDWLEPQAAAA